MNQFHPSVFLTKSLSDIFYRSYQYLGFILNYIYKYFSIYMFAQSLETLL